MQAALAANARGGAASALPIAPLSTGMPAAVVGAQPPASGAPAAATAAAQVAPVPGPSTGPEKACTPAGLSLWKLCICSQAALKLGPDHEIGWRAHWRTADARTKGGVMQVKCVAARAGAPAAVSQPGAGAAAAVLQPGTGAAGADLGLKGWGVCREINGRARPAQALLQQFPNLAPALQAQTLAMVQQFQLAQQQAAAAAAAGGGPAQSAPRPAVQAAQARAAPAVPVLGLPWRCGGRGASAGLTAQAELRGRRRARAVEDGLGLMICSGSARITRCSKMSTWSGGSFCFS